MSAATTVPNVVLQLFVSSVSAIVSAGSTHASLSSWPLWSVTNAVIVIVASVPACRSPVHVYLFTGFSCKSQWKLPVASTFSGIRPVGSGSTTTTFDAVAPEPTFVTLWTVIVYVVFSFAVAEPGPCFSIVRSSGGLIVVSTDDVLFVSSPSGIVLFGSTIAWFVIRM